MSCAPIHLQTGQGYNVFNVKAVSWLKQILARFERLGFSFVFPTGKSIEYDGFISLETMLVEYSGQGMGLRTLLANGLREKRQLQEEQELRIFIPAPCHYSITRRRRIRIELVSNKSRTSQRPEQIFSNNRMK